MEGKLDVLLSNVDASIRRADGHEVRIGKLERWQSWTLGAGAAVGVAMAALWNIFTALSHGR